MSLTEIGYKKSFVYVIDTVSITTQSSFIKYKND